MDTIAEGAVLGLSYRLRQKRGRVQRQSSVLMNLFYWSKVSANPFQTEAGLELAIDRLLQNGRVHEAVLCIERIIHGKQPLDNKQAIRTLDAVLESPGTVVTHDAYAIVDIIKALQETPGAEKEQIINIEWAFLPLLDEQYEASPKLLQQRLADEPKFFLRSYSAHFSL